MICKTNLDNWHFLRIHSMSYYIGKRKWWIYDDVFIFSKKFYLRKLLILF